MVFCQEFCPLFIDQIAICLDCIVYFNTLPLILLLQFYHTAVKLQPCQSRLPALKSKGADMFCVFHACAYDPLHLVERQHSLERLFPMFRDILIKAICTGHIACGRRRLD